MKRALAALCGAVAVASASAASAATYIVDEEDQGSLGLMIQRGDRITVRSTAGTPSLIGGATLNAAFFGGTLDGKYFWGSTFETPYKDLPVIFAHKPDGFTIRFEIPEDVYRETNDCWLDVCGTYEQERYSGLVMADLIFSQGSAGKTYSVTVTSGVPEPATWAMLIGGFGLAGAALRRRSALSRAVGVEGAGHHAV